MEKVTVEGDSKRAFHGLYIGAVIAAGLLVFAIALVLTGHQAAGITFGTADIAGLVGALVYGNHSRRQERKEKADLMARAQAATTRLGGVSPEDADGTD